MEIPLPVKIGEVIWSFPIGTIRSSPVRRIHIEITYEKNPRVTFETEDYMSYAPKDEGTQWWRTREAMVEYLRENLLGNPKPLKKSILKRVLFPK